MRKIIYGMASVIFMMMILSTTANASLQLSVTVQTPTLSPSQTQTIHAITNQRGWGIVFVVQPSDGELWTDFVNTSSHSLLYWRWLYLETDVKANVSSEIGSKIVSYTFVDTAREDGWDFVLAYPMNFTDINGVSSTAALGEYKVIFVFWNSCTICVTKFACGVWLVIPQVPFGTVMALVSALGALPAFKLYRKKRPA